MAKGREVVEDYRSHGLTLRAHPLAFLRKQPAEMGVTLCAELKDMPDGKRLTVAGLVLVRQKPGSAKCVMFLTLEDEGEIANLIVWPSLFEKQRSVVIGAQMLVCRGKVQKATCVIHVIAEHLIDRSEMLPPSVAWIRNSSFQPGVATKPSMPATVSIRAKARFSKKPAIS